MGKHKQFREIDKAAKVPIWVERINLLLRENQVTQQELAQGCDLSPSRISDWIGINKKTGQYTAPRIDGIIKIANFFGVSVDYIVGTQECKVPTDEEIHKTLGLSDGAIQQLKRINNAQGDDIVSEKEIRILNYLLENITDTELFENIYNYLIGCFSFPGKEDTLGAAHMVEQLPSGKQQRNITFKEVFSQASFVCIQHDLMRLKDSATKNNSSLYFAETT